MTTQGFMKTKTMLAGSFFAFLLISCEKDDDDENTAGNTINGIVVRTDDFSTRERAVVKANVQATLSGTGPYTVFAPDNAAFTASGVTAAVLNTLTAGQARNSFPL